LKERFKNVITKQNPTHLWQKKIEEQSEQHHCFAQAIE
jgi:hypothetical protein